MGLLEEMRQDLDTYLARYNTQRPHLALNMKGRTPAQAFRDGLPNDSKGGNNKAAQIPIPGGCIVRSLSSLDAFSNPVPITRLGLYIVILLTLSRLDMPDQCSELIHFLHPCICFLPKPRTASPPYIHLRSQAPLAIGCKD